jgi:hypothetical protein
MHSLWRIGQVLCAPILRTGRSTSPHQDWLARTCPGLVQWDLRRTLFAGVVSRISLSTVHAESGFPISFSVCPHKSDAHGRDENSRSPHRQASGRSRFVIGNFVTRTARIRAMLHCSYCNDNSSVQFVIPSHGSSNL